MINRRSFIKNTVKFVAGGAALTMYAPSNLIASSSEEISLGFIPKSLNNPVFKITRKGALDRISELNDNINLRWVGPTTTDAAAQSQILDNLVVQGVKGICLSCNDDAALLPAINRATDAGVVVITWDSDSPNSKRLTNVAIDQHEAAAMAGRMLAKWAPKGKCAVLQGTPGALNLEQRLAGFRSVIDKIPEIEIISVDPNYDDVQKAVEIVEQRINATPDLASYFFVGMWPFFADLQTMPKLKNFVSKGGIVVSLDTLEGALKAVKEGYCNGLIGYSWWGFGKTAVDVLVNKITKGIDPPDPMYTALYEVDKTNIDALWEKHVATGGAF